jgi:Ser/Thr protein kinase RdoA (MazF antagonist)
MTPCALAGRCVSCTRRSLRTAGNLLRIPGGLLWNDFGDAFRGPVLWDVSGYLISLALDAYGGLDREALAPFTAGHQLYDEIWSANDAQRRV